MHITDDYPVVYLSDVNFKIIYSGYIADVYTYTEVTLNNLMCYKSPY